MRAPSQGLDASSSSRVSRTMSATHTHSHTCVRSLFTPPGARENGAERLPPSCPSLPELPRSLPVRASGQNRRKLAWMLLAPASPYGGKQHLQQSRQWGREDRPPQTKQVRASDQRDDGNGRVESHRLPQYPRCDYVAFQDMDEDEIGQHQQRQKPALGRRHQYTHCSGGQRAHRRNELQGESQ